MSSGTLCYNCQKRGHFARECPEENTGERRSTKDKTCYNCGETGHLSRACPNPAQEGSERKADRRRPSRRGPKCYNCGDFGHISRECPSADAGPKCYMCSGFGHISRFCPSQPKEGEEAAMDTTVEAAEN